MPHQARTLLLLGPAEKEGPVGHRAHFAPSGGNHPQNVPQAVDLGLLCMGFIKHSALHGRARVRSSQGARLCCLMKSSPSSLSVGRVAKGASLTAIRLNPQPAPGLAWPPILHIPGGDPPTSLRVLQAAHGVKQAATRRGEARPPRIVQVTTTTCGHLAKRGSKGFAVIAAMAIRAWVLRGSGSGSSGAPTT